MTDTNQLIEAFVKTLEEADIITTNTSDLTSTQFECLRVVMDSLDIEPGTVDGWEAMRVVGNGDRNELVWVGFDGRTYTHEEFVRLMMSCVSSTMGLSDEEHRRTGY